MKKALIAVLLLLVSIGAGWFWWSGRDARDAKDELLLYEIGRAHV